jgi:hypothetical protein
MKQIRRFAGSSQKLNGRIPNQEGEGENLIVSFISLKYSSIKDLKFNERELEGYKKFIEENLIKITENCLLSIKKHDLKLQNEKNGVGK